jgi:hypothetical protein
LLRITALLESVGDAHVVINSSWVPQHGYRTVLELFPEPLKARVIGATAPGNRRLGAGASTRDIFRRGLVERDYLKRRPNAVVVVERDASCVPTLLRGDAFILETGLWMTGEQTWMALAEVLKKRLREGAQTSAERGEKNY